MYEEGNRRLSFNWGTLAIKLVIIALIIFIACWIFVRVTDSKNSSINGNSLASGNSEYITNITAMKNAAFEYFTPSKLPSNIGETEKLTLAQMFNQKLLIDFSNDGETCDTNSSYVQATKTADGNYALKVSLTCNEKSDFIVTTIEDSPDCTSEVCNNITNSDVVVDTNTDNNESSSTSNNSTTTSSSNSSSTSSSSSSSSSSNQVYAKPVTSTVTTTVKTTVNIKISCSSIGCCSSNCNSNTNNNTNNNTNINNNQPSEPVTPTEPEKTRYYKFVKWSDWDEGYSYVAGAENKKVTVTTYNYCKLNEKTYYTTSYVVDSDSAKTYQYELQLLDIDPNNIVDSTISVINSSKSYFDSTSLKDYNAYIDTRDMYIYMTGSTGLHHAMISNASLFKASSLTKTNFTFDVSGVYLSGGTYRVTITIYYKNRTGVTPYYASNLGYNVYFVPLKFNVSYSNKTDCVRDTADNASKYNGYSISDLKTETIWQHRIPTYTWSTEKTLSGWEYTGEYEDR